MSNNTQKGRDNGVHVGSTSVLLIFVLLALVSFAVLSFVSANADYKLTSKVTDRTLSYYEAVSEAEESLARLDVQLQEAYKTCADAEAYFALTGEKECFTIPLQGTQSLQVEVDILFPLEADDTFYRVTSSKVVDNIDL